MNFKLAIASIGLLSLQAMATPAQIVIIRHGEKPDVGDHLSSQGCERAFGLPSFFRSTSIVNQFGRPVAIYAMAPDKDKDEASDESTPEPKNEQIDHSVRPIETIAPTAMMLGLKIQAPFYRDQFSQLRDDIMKNKNYDGRTVIISWEHHAIPQLAQTLGAKVKNSEQKWPGEVFDQAWILTFDKKTKAKLDIIPEQVLATDSNLGGSKGWSEIGAGSSCKKSEFQKGTCVVYPMKSVPADPSGGLCSDDAVLDTEIQNLVVRLPDDSNI